MATWASPDDMGEHIAMDWKRTVLLETERSCAENCVFIRRTLSKDMPRSTCENGKDTRTRPKRENGGVFSL